MHFLSTLQLLVQFLIRPIRGSTHQERLESFYGYQARHYDRFRKTFLRGRDELVSKIPFCEGDRWVDLGCGTGYLLEAAEKAAGKCSKIFLVDLCPSLLKIAEEKVKSRGWNHVETCLEESHRFRPSTKVDVVTLSYTLSMTPNWYAAIDQARSMLREGGTIGVVDFYIARKHPMQPLIHQPWRTRHFWPLWFDTDHVAPSPDHLPYLLGQFSPAWLQFGRTQVPAMPWFRPPYFCFVGGR